MTESRVEQWRELVGEEVDVYARAGFGRTGGLGRRPAVLIVDMTYLFVDPAYIVTAGNGGAIAVANVARLLEAARGRGFPVFYSKRNSRLSQASRGTLDSKWGFTADEQWLHDKRADEFPPEIAPMNDDVIIEKAKPSAFFETPLRSIITYVGVDSLIICGISTSGCVRAAVTDAFSSNLRVVVPSECCFDRSEFAHRANLFDMDMKFADVDPLDRVLQRIDEGGFAWTEGASSPA